ncbi:hypothetical protein CYMTET_13417 [Cymbomonas tetramitiformis]|uniref:Uncharacterized protein n=1 Tax=Cymbomonas tetramitiformis TaxID=36881 RepID=A0AAE0LB35_9CHLO|nr:hypothetical protein CYMTET_13417 [Cymbomonas tetramitiformis]
MLSGSAKSRLCNLLTEAASHQEDVERYERGETGASDNEEEEDPKDKKEKKCPYSYLWEGGTIEGLLKLLKDSEGSALIVNDEFITLLTELGLNKQGKGGAAHDIGILLKLYNGQSLRKKNVKSSMSLDNLQCNILAFSQYVTAGAFASQDFQGNGFKERWIVHHGHKEFRSWTELLEAINKSKEDVTTPTMKEVLHEIRLGFKKRGKGVLIFFNADSNALYGEHWMEVELQLEALAREGDEGAYARLSKARAKLLRLVFAMFALRLGVESAFDKRAKYGPMPLLPPEILPRTRASIDEEDAESEGADAQGAFSQSTQGTDLASGSQSAEIWEAWQVPMHVPSETSLVDLEAAREVERFTRAQDTKVAEFHGKEGVQGKLFTDEEKAYRAVLLAPGTFMRNGDANHNSEFPTKLRSKAKVQKVFHDMVAQGLAKEVFLGKIVGEADSGPKSAKLMKLVFTDLDTEQGETFASALALLNISREEYERSCALPNPLARRTSDMSEASEHVPSLQRRQSVGQPSQPTGLLATLSEDDDEQAFQDVPITTRPRRTSLTQRRSSTHRRALGALPSASIPSALSGALRSPVKSPAPVALGDVPPAVTQATQGSSRVVSPSPYDFDHAGDDNGHTEYEMSEYESLILHEMHHQPTLSQLLAEPIDPQAFSREPQGNQLAQHSPSEAQDAVDSLDPPPVETNPSPNPGPKKSRRRSSECETLRHSASLFGLFDKEASTGGVVTRRMSTGGDTRAQPRRMSGGGSGGNTGKGENPSGTHKRNKRGRKNAAASGSGGSPGRGDSILEATRAAVARMSQKQTLQPISEAAAPL